MGGNKYKQTLADFVYFVDFQTDHMILWKMNKAQMKQRGSRPEPQQFVYTWTEDPIFFHFLSDCSYF